MILLPLVSGCSSSLMAIKMEGNSHKTHRTEPGPGRLDGRRPAPPRRAESRVRPPGSVNSPLDHTLLRPVSTSEHEAECAEERRLFVLLLS